jgi:hypothetical protein
VTVAPQISDRATARAEHFEATLHRLAGMARRYRKVISCGQVIEEIGRALATAPENYAALPKWQPIEFALKNRTIVARVREQKEPVVCVYKPGNQHMMAGWWARGLRVEPYEFFNLPPFERTGA